MSRRFVVPLLVVAVFLSGCRSAQQGAAVPADSPFERVNDWYCATEQSCEEWLDGHPVARSVVCGIGLTVLTVAVVGLVVLVLYLELRDDH
jgi:hypothetical protein